MPAAAYAGNLHGLNFSQPIDLPVVRSSRDPRRDDSPGGATARVIGNTSGSARSRETGLLRRSAAQREMQLAEGNVELLEDLRRRIQVQVNVGEAARLELTRAEAEVASARIAVRSAELRQAAALSALYAAVGSPLGQVEPEGDLQRPKSCRR